MASIRVTDHEGEFNIPYTNIGKLVFDVNANIIPTFLEGTIIRFASGAARQIIDLLNTGVVCRCAMVTIANAHEAIILDQYENIEICIFEITEQCELTRVFGLVSDLCNIQRQIECCANLLISKVRFESMVGAIAGRQFNKIMMRTIVHPDTINAFSGIANELILVGVNQVFLDQIRNINIPRIIISGCCKCSIDPILENPNVTYLRMISHPIFNTQECHLLEFICPIQNDMTNIIRARVAENLLDI